MQNYWTRLKTTFHIFWNFISVFIQSTIKLLQVNFTVKETVKLKTINCRNCLFLFFYIHKYIIGNFTSISLSTSLDYLKTPNIDKKWRELQIVSLDDPPAWYKPPTAKLWPMPSHLCFSAHIYHLVFSVGPFIKEEPVHL